MEEVNKRGRPVLDAESAAEGRNLNTGEYVLTVYGYNILTDSNELKVGVGGQNIHEFILLSIFILTNYYIKTLCLLV